MSADDGGLLPALRRDTRLRFVVSGAYLGCAVMGAGMFGSGASGRVQFVEDFGEAFAQWPLTYFGCLAAMLLELLWPRTPLVLLGFAGAFLAALGPGLIRGMRIT